jgi:ABC-type sulfate transport system permease subunit
VSSQAHTGRGVRALLLGLALTYVVVLLIAPLAGIAYYALKPGFGSIVDTLQLRDVQHAFYLTAVIMFVAVVVTGVLGIVVALVLVRDRFAGKAFRRSSTCRSPSPPSSSGLWRFCSSGRRGGSSRSSRRRGSRSCSRCPR